MTDWTDDALNSHDLWVDQLDDRDQYEGTKSLDSYLNDIDEAEKKIIDNPGQYPFHPKLPGTRVYRGKKYKIYYRYAPPPSPVIVGVEGL